MNLPANFGAGDEPEWLAAKDKFMAILDKHDKPYGGFALPNPPFGSLEAVKSAAERMSFMTITGDVLHLGNMGNDLQQVRELLS